MCQSFNDGTERNALEHKKVTKLVNLASKKALWKTHAVNSEVQVCYIHAFAILIRYSTVILI